MLGIILLFPLVFGTMIYGTVKENEKIMRVSFMLLFILIIFIMFIISAEENFRKVNKDVIKEELIYEIYSLKDSKNIEGKFFLGRGYIETEEYYYFYIKTERGLTLEKIKVNDIYIKETDEESPKFVYQYHENTYLIFNEFFRIFGMNPYTKDKVLKVPSGTVTKEYTIDLESPTNKNKE